MTLREKLREQLTQRLVPELKRRGFEGPAAIAGNHPRHEFKRRKGSVTQVLAVQLEKRGLPRFALDLQIEPEQGVDNTYRRGGVIHSGRATPKPGPFTRSWFRADPPIWNRLLGSKSREAEAVSEALALIEELEDWLSNPRQTKHIVDLSFTAKGREDAA